MELNLFSPLHVTQLSINDLYSLNQTTISYAQPVIADMGAMPQAILTRLKAANEAMGARMNRVQREALTPAVEAADTDRDGCGKDLKREVRTASKSRDTAKQDAGNRLLLFLEPYWNFDREALNTESGIIDQFMVNYQADSELVAAAATIGVDGLVTELASLNNTFKSLYDLRNTTEAATEGSSASELKPEAVGTYEQLCTAIEQTATFTPSDNLTALFNKMDSLRKKYARLISKNSNGQTKNQEAETAE